MALVVCSACSTRLKVDDHLLGERIKCPTCGARFVAADDEVQEPVEPEETAITEKPRGKAKPRVDDEEDDFVEEEDDRPKKKKKKKKRAKRNPTWVFVTGESMPVFLGGGGAVLVIELALLGAAIFFPSHHPSKYFAAYLFIMLPISTLIFFGSMYLSSLVGAFEIGEIPIAMIKGFFLIMIVNIVSLIPCVGYFFTGIVWLVGVITIFKVDVWDARVLIGINWILNLIASLLVFLLLASLMPMVGGGRDFDDDDLPDRDMVWNADTIKALGGQVRFSKDDEDEVVDISLANRPIHDAHLAHMNDFPRLQRLNLTNTSITDKGLVHLHECRGLQKVTLKGTRVTDAGVRELERALPKCVIQK